MRGSRVPDMATASAKPPIAAAKSIVCARMVLSAPDAAMVPCLGEQGKRRGMGRPASEAPDRAAGMRRPAHRPEGRYLGDRLGGDDLNAEARETHIVVVGRGQQANRGNAEVFEDLRAEADFAPLPLARGFRPVVAVLRQRRYRHAGRAVWWEHQD